jgi:hypothetical protein
LIVGCKFQQKRITTITNNKKNAKDAMKPNSQRNLDFVNQRPAGQEEGEKKHVKVSE